MISNVLWHVNFVVFSLYDCLMLNLASQCILIFLFFSYTLFPLLLLLDAAIECRSMQNIDSKEKFRISDVSNPPNHVSDSLAEGVVTCLEEVLRKCCLKSVDQVGRFSLTFVLTSIQTSLCFT